MSIEWNRFLNKMKNKKDKYEPKDLPSRKKMDEDISAAKIIFKANKLFSLIGLGSSKLRNIEPQLEDLMKLKNELIQYPTKYNRYFSEKGWIAHDSMDFEIIKTAVDLYDQNKPKEAEDLIKDYYSPSEIESRLIYLRHIPEFKIRIRLLENALQDYKNKRYYAVIPLLLMIIDGVINDVMQKGFHTDNLDLSVWDSMTSTDTGIQVVKEIFTRTRRKTNSEELDLPFRNGILHGRDLAYDNYTVACKSWAFVFFVRDWIISKKTEKDRLEKFTEKNKVKSLSELAKDFKELDKLKAATASWKARQISSEYIENINLTKIADEKEPECLVINFLELWKKNNFGKMAESFSKTITDNYKKYAAEVRSIYGNQVLDDYQIMKIIDEASAISEVNVRLTFSSSVMKKVTFRCIYERGFADSLPRGFQGGNWKLVWMQDFNTKDN